MIVSIRLFATLRDRAGTSTIELELPQDATVANLLERVAKAYPSLHTSLSTVLVAINEEYAFRDDPVCEGDDVALFPAVSGG